MTSPMATATPIGLITGSPRAPMPSMSSPSTAPPASISNSVIASLALAENRDSFQVHFPPSKTFILNSTMLRLDTPNMFSTLFLSPPTPFADVAGPSFRERAARRITIADRSPELFTFIYDYLCGYSIFPLREEAVPPKWLPLAKCYHNLRRDAGYYGLVRLEADCRRWMRTELFPKDEQAVLKLDFHPFRTGPETVKSMISDVMLECNIADAALLRRRFLEFRSAIGQTQPLCYGPFPWKHMLDTIRSHENEYYILQTDGSALVDAPPVFVKPPRTAALDTTDRKYECARILVTPQVTTHLLDPAVKPSQFSNSPTLRIHATDCTIIFRFGTKPPHCHLVFHERAAADGFACLQGYIFPRLPAQKKAANDKQQGANLVQEFEIASGENFPMDVDGQTVLWEDVTRWARCGPFLGPPLEKYRSSTSVDCEMLFSRNCEDETRQNMVHHPPLHHVNFSSRFGSVTGTDVQAVVYGDVTFTFQQEREYIMSPASKRRLRIISVRGSSERKWEGKRVSWHGDCDRDRSGSLRKRARTEVDGEEREQSVENIT